MRDEGDLKKWHDLGYSDVEARQLARMEKSMSGVKVKPQETKALQPKIVITIIDPTRNPLGLKIETRGLKGWGICALMLAQAQLEVIKRDLAQKQSEKRLIEVPSMELMG